jgi:hypothetical protein
LLCSFAGILPIAVARTEGAAKLVNFKHFDKNGAGLPLIRKQQKASQFAIDKEITQMEPVARLIRFSEKPYQSAIG